MKKQITLIIGILFLAGIIPLSAQEEITDPTIEIETWINNLTEQVEIAQNYTTYTSTIDEVVENIVQAQTTLSIVPIVSYNSDNQHITRYIDNENETAQVVINYEIIESVDDMSASYLVTTDVRFIDNTYYYLMTTDNTELSEQLELSNNWEIVAPEDIIGLPIADFSNPFNAEMILLLLEIAPQASRIAMGSTTIEDTTYNTLSLGFNGPAFLQFSTELGDLSIPLETLSDSEWGALLLDALGQQIDNDVILVSFFTDEDEQLVGFSIEYYFLIDTRGKTVEDPNLQNIYSEINFFRREILTNINQPIPLIETPEVSQQPDPDTQ